MAARPICCMEVLRIWLLDISMDRKIHAIHPIVAVMNQIPLVCVSLPEVNILAANNIIVTITCLITDRFSLSVIFRCDAASPNIMNKIYLKILSIPQSIGLNGTKI